MKKVHISAMILLLLAGLLAGCSSVLKVENPSDLLRDTGDTGEAPVVWFKNDEVYKIEDAGPAKVPFNVCMFVTGYSSNSFPRNKGIEEYAPDQEVLIEIEIRNASTVPYADQAEDLKLDSFSPSVTIRSEQQAANSSKENVIRKVFPELKDVVLKPGEAYSVKWSWDHKDAEGKKVNPGSYMILLDSFEQTGPITYTGADGKPSAQENFICMPFSVNYIKITE